VIDYGLSNQSVSRIGATLPPFGRRFVQNIIVDRFPKNRIFFSEQQPTNMGTEFFVEKILAKRRRRVRTIFSCFNHVWILICGF